jgi:hypothetical protein
MFACPSCHASLRFDVQKQVLACNSCETSGQVLADNLVTFLGPLGPNAQAILGWPEAEMRDLEPLLVKLRNGDVLPRAAVDKLVTLGLLTPDGKQTKLGELAAYNASEFVWQSEYDPLEGMFSLPPFTPDSRVLDLGCGSGQTLRRVFGDFAGTLVGVDCSNENTASGS